MNKQIQLESINKSPINLKKNKKRYHIKKTNLILVEGKSDLYFVDEILKKKGWSDQIQIVQVEGKNNFKSCLDNLQNSPPQKNCLTFDQVQSFAFIRDADNDFKASFQSACDTLKACALPAPQKAARFTTQEGIKTGVYILPDNKSKGALEDLFLKTIPADDKRLKCVDQFFDCIAKLPDDKLKTPKKSKKAKTRIYLASTEESLSHISYAVQKGFLNLETPLIKGLVQFLDDLHNKGGA